MCYGKVKLYKVIFLTYTCVVWLYIFFFCFLYCLDFNDTSSEAIPNNVTGYCRWFVRKPFFKKIRAYIGRPLYTLHIPKLSRFHRFIKTDSEEIKAIFNRWKFKLCSQVSIVRRRTVWTRESINRLRWKQLVLDEVFVIGYSTLAFLVVSWFFWSSSGSMYFIIFIY